MKFCQLSAWIILIFISLSTCTWLCFETYQYECSFQFEYVLLEMNWILQEEGHYLLGLPFEASHFLLGTQTEEKLGVIASCKLFAIYVLFTSELEWGISLLIVTYVGGRNMCYMFGKNIHMNESMQTVFNLTLKFMYIFFACTTNEVYQ